MADSTGCPLGSTLPGLTVSVVHQAEEPTITFAGDLEMSTVELFRDSIIAALNSRPARLVVDCSMIHFCSSAGLRAMMDVQQRASTSGTSMIILVSHSLERIVERLGLSDRIHTVSTLEEAGVRFA